ncbi:MAG: TatD family hydrolase [Candidatus Aenigmatarchaeota archaeon]
MIDAHCHLEQKDYDADRDEVVARCKEAVLKAVVFSCARPKDFEKSLEIAEKYRGFAFFTAGIHPEYIKEISGAEIAAYFEKLRANKDKIVGIGECGLDYYWTKEPEWRKNQKALFKRHIELAKELNLPLVIHSRDAEADCLGILENEGAKNVLMHFFSDKNLAERVAKDGYFISFNTLLLKSKGHRKILKKTPLERIITETDAPWLGFGKRNEPVAVKDVTEKIAELLKKPVEEIDQTTTKNAEGFYGLKT